MNQAELLTLWVSLLGIGALLIRVGQALCAVGSARSKNAISAVARNLCDLSAAVLLFGLLGIYLLTGGTTANGVGGIPIVPPALTLHFSGLMLIATAIVAPALSERSRFAVPLVGTLIISAILFPLFGRWVWYGWLAQTGVIDVAGALPVHLTGALCAGVGAYWVGPRLHKYNHDGSTTMIPPHQGALPALGSLLILAGWLPAVMGSALLREFDAGVSAVAAAGLNALVASAAGALGSVAMLRLRSTRLDLGGLCAGLLGGAVAMTAAGGAVSPWQAALLGLIAGAIVPSASRWLDFRCRIDDPGGVIIPHGVGAIIALMGAAIFAPLGIAGRVHALGAQCLGIGVVSLVAVVVAWSGFWLLSLVHPLRVSEAEEFDGLDLAQHDLNAYPDFQQTMIKSYHLRET
jgi:Amt family ammonium transporter